MDRGEIDVEEERRVRMKRMPVLPTDGEKHESESAHVASRSQCKTQDSRKHLEIESSLPRVAMDRGFLAQSTDADLVMNTMLIQKPHNVVEPHQESHEAPGPHVVNCALKDLDANGLGRVLLQGSVESDAQTPVDPDWVGRGERMMAESDAQTFVGPGWAGRGERMMAEKSSKCLHQSRGAGENDVRKIESSAKTDDPVLPEELGCRADSKGIVPPWVAGCATLQSEKHRNVRTRSRVRKFRDVMTQDDRTVDPGDERGEMATVNPVRVTGTSLGRTDANEECPSQVCTASEHWQPGVSSSPTSVPSNGGKLALKPLMGHRRKYVSKSFIRRKNVTIGCPEHKGVSSRRVSGR